MSTYSEVVDAADALTLEEQESLLELLQRRLALEKRRLLKAEVSAARAEHEQGATQATPVEQIMRSVVDDT